MSEEQLSALLAKLKEDVVLQEKLKSVADLDAVLVIAREAGFDISKADWLKYQAKRTQELRDEELEEVAGGCKNSGVTLYTDCPPYCVEYRGTDFGCEG